MQQQALLFESPPDIFEVPLTLIDDMLPLIQADQSVLFTNVWGIDAQVLALRDFSLYLDPFERGAQLIQSEFPLAVLKALNRSWEDP